MTDMALRGKRIGLMSVSQGEAVAEIVSPFNSNDSLLASSLFSRISDNTKPGLPDYTSFGLMTDVQLQEYDELLGAFEAREIPNDLVQEFLVENAIKTMAQKRIPEVKGEFVLGPVRLSVIDIGGEFALAGIVLGREVEESGLMKGSRKPLLDIPHIMKAVGGGVLDRKRIPNTTQPGQYGKPKRWNPWLTVILGIGLVSVVATQFGQKVITVESSAPESENNPNATQQGEMPQTAFSTPDEAPTLTPTIPLPTVTLTPTPKKSPEQIKLDKSPVYKDEKTGVAYERFYADGYVWYVDSNNAAVKVWDPEKNEDTTFEKTGKQGFKLLDGTFVTMEYSPSIPIPVAGPDIEGKPSFKSWEEASQYIVNVRDAKHTDSFLENQLNSPETQEEANLRMAQVRSVTSNSGNNMHPSFMERFVKTISGEEIYVRCIIFEDFLVVDFVVDDETGDWMFDFITIDMTEEEFNERYDLLAGMRGNMPIWKQMVLPDRVVSKK